MSQAGSRGFEYRWNVDLYVRSIICGFPNRSGQSGMRALALALLVTCSCGDNIGGLVDAAAPDAGPDAPEVVRCQVPEIGAIGGFCTTDSCVDPSAGALTTVCLDNTLPVPWPPGGFCTAIECTTDADCGEGSVCGQLSNGEETFGACLPACCEGVGVGDVCSVGRICTDNAFGENLGVAACLPGTPAVPDGAPCEDFGACDINSTCRADPFIRPGGQCTVLGCTADSDCAPGGAGRCVNLAEDQVGNLCVDDCDVDADCRTDEGYRCIDHGVPAGKFCRHPGPGDLCGTDPDCGTGEPADPWSCRETNATNAYPGGYCTVEDCSTTDGDTCPIFSFCVELQDEGDTFCADECAMGSAACGTGYQCAAVGATGDFACIPDGAVIVDPV
jgi:hypothetical protein